MYYEKLLENGFDEMDILFEVEQSHLTNIGMKPGHQIKLKKYLSEYKQENNNKNDDSHNASINGSMNKSTIRIRVSDSRLESAKTKENNINIMNTSTQSFDNNNVKLNHVNMSETTKNFVSLYHEETSQPNITKSNIFIPLDDEFNYMSESQFTQKSDTQCAKLSKERDIKNINDNYKNLSINNETRVSVSKKPTVKNDCGTTKEAKECYTQFDGRRKFCFNCFSVIDYNVGEPIYNDDFKNQVFCSKKCLKIQYLENSTFCKNESCEKGHFLKPSGILNNGDWYCSNSC